MIVRGKSVRQLKEVSMLLGAAGDAISGRDGDAPPGLVEEFRRDAPEIGARDLEAMQLALTFAFLYLEGSVHPMGSDELATFMTGALNDLRAEKAL